MASSNSVCNSPARLELNIQSHPANLADARRSIEQFAARCGFDVESQNEIGLVLNEAMANVIRHAYSGATDRPVQVTAEYDGASPGTLRLSLRDWGNGVNPDELPSCEHDPLTPGGVGMICLRGLMDKITFARQADGMLLTMSRANDGRSRTHCCK